MTSALTILLLFASGIALMLAEFLLPGLIMGVIGAGLLLASMVMAWVTYPDSALPIVAGQILGTVVSMGLGMWGLSHTRMGRVLVLDDAQDPDAGWTSPGESPDLLGRDGIVHSALRPTGTVLVDGDRINVVSSGVFIEKDRPVLVVEVEGHRVVVEEILRDSAS